MNMGLRSSGRQVRRRGLSLLEIILSLAILAGSIAVLSEVSRRGLQNARMAQDRARALLLCESKLAEVLAGLVPAESQEETPFESESDPSESEWLYSIEVNSITEDGLMEVRVTVVKDLPPEKRPVEVRLVRWMIDPSAASSGEATGSESGSEGLF